MVNLVEMDEKVTFFEEMEEKNDGPAILINKFTVKPEEVDQLLRAWASDATYFKGQPGCISAQLHCRIERSCVFLNYAIWESTELFKKAFKNPELQSHLEKYPPSAIASPHLFKRLAVPEICGE